MKEVTPMVNSVSGQTAFNLTYTPASKGPGGVLELVSAIIFLPARLLRAV